MVVDGGGGVISFLYNSMFSRFQDFKVSRFQNYISIHLPSKSIQSHKNISECIDFNSFVSRGKHGKAMGGLFSE